MEFLNEKALDLYTRLYFDNLENNILVINDKIDNDIIDLIILPLIEMDKDKSCKHIDIYLNTFGGEVGVTFALINVIENIKTSTTIHLLGDVFSAGFYIAMAGHNNPKVKTVCTPFTRAMFHASYVYNEEGDDECREVLTLEKFQKNYDEEIIFKYVKSHSKITDEMLNEWKDTEKYFTAKELEELGVANIE